MSSILYWLLGPYSSYWVTLPSLNACGGGHLVLLKLYMPCFIDTHETLTLSWMETEEEGLEGEWREDMGKGTGRGGRGRLWLECKINRIIKNKTKRGIYSFIQCSS